MVQFAIVGNRVPYRYFLASGQGESDAGSKGLPAETGSYDAALNSAGIEDANIVKYTSVVPPGAKEMSQEEGTRSIRWGEVMEAIMGQANGKAGDTISAAVMITSVHNAKGQYIGSFACEYSGNGTENEAKKALGLSISGMIERRGYGKTATADIGVGATITTDSGYKYHPGQKFVWSSMDVKKKHGTVLAGICFREYQVPIIKLPEATPSPAIKTRKRTTRRATKKKKGGKRSRRRH